MWPHAHADGYCRQISRKLQRKITIFMAYWAMTKPIQSSISRYLVSQKFQPPSGDGRGVAFLILAGAQRGRWLVLGEFAKYAFCGLKRKRRDFERSVLKYVSIKIPALTHSGRKSRVCVNAADRLSPGAKSKTSLYFSASPAAKSCLFVASALPLPLLLLLPFCLSRLAIKSWSLRSLP